MTTYPFLNQEIAFSALACTQRYAGEGELVFGLTEYRATLPGPSSACQWVSLAVLSGL
jgi:hypothetical protein